MKRLPRLLVAVFGCLVWAQAALASQATLVTPGSPLSMTGLAAFLNGAFLSVGSCNAGNSAPSNGTGGAAFAGECWINTTANPWVFNYTADGTHWSPFGELNTSTFVFTPYSGSSPALIAGNNLSDVASVVTAFANIVQPSTASALGGVNSLTCPSHKLFVALSTLGVFTCAQLGIGDISGWGTGVAAALGVNIGSAGAPVLFNGALGTPSSGLLGVSVTLGGVTMGLGSDASGDIYYNNGGVFTRLPKGSNGQVLQLVAGLPGWASVSGVGTVTSVTCNAGLTGGTFTSSGTCAQDGNYSGWALQNCTLAASVNSNILTVALKDNAGNDPSSTSPCNINYRNVTPGTGSTTLVQQAAALSISTFATGATLGSVNGQPFRFWVVVFNNAGTNVLGLVNCTSWTLAGNATVFALNERAPASSTPISGSATSAGVIYTPNGTTVSSKAFRIVGYIEYSSGLTTAGSYASAPTAIQNFGPGVPRPGERVQGPFLTSGTTPTTGTGSYVATANAASITPTAAMNLIAIDTVANVRMPSTGTPSMSVELRRGTSTVVSVPQGAINNGGDFITAPGSVSAMDLPGVTSSVTYTVYLNGSSSSVSYPESQGSGGYSMKLEEIMGANDNEKFGLPALPRAA